VVRRDCSLGQEGGASPRAARARLALGAGRPAALADCRRVCSHSSPTALLAARSSGGAPLRRPARRRSVPRSARRTAPRRARHNSLRPRRAGAPQPIRSAAVRAAPDPGPRAPRASPRRRVPCSAAGPRDARRAAPTIRQPRRVSSSAATAPRSGAGRSGSALSAAGEGSRARRTRRPPVLHVLGRAQEPQMAGKLSQRLLEVMERHGDAGARVKLGAVVGDREDPGRRCGRQGHRERVDDTEQLGARGPRSARSGRSPARRRRRRPRARSWRDPVHPPPRARSPTGRAPDRDARLGLPLARLDPDRAVHGRSPARPSPWLRRSCTARTGRYPSSMVAYPLSRPHASTRRRSVASHLIGASIARQQRRA
jgi:hypothetical protein